MSNTRPWRELSVSLIGASLVTLSLFFPWLTARGTSDSFSNAAISLPIFPWIIGILIATALVGNIAVVFRPSRTIHLLATLAATVTLLAPVVSIIAINIVAVFATPAFLPSTFRRVLIGVTPSTGMWLAIVGGIFTTIAAIEKAPAFITTSREAARRLVRGDRTVVAVTLALAGSILYLVSRYQPWVTLNFAATDNATAHWAIPGFALPVVGIVSIFEIIAIMTCAIWQIARPSLGTATAMTVVGFAPLFYGAIGVCLRFSPVRINITIPHYVAQTLAQWAPSTQRLSNGYLKLPTLSHDLRAQLVIGPGSTLSLLAGVLVTLAGLILIHTHRFERASL